MVNRIKQVRNSATCIAFAATVVILLNSCCKDRETTALTQREVPITEKIKGVIIEGPWDVVIVQDSVNNTAVLEYNVPENKITAELLPNGYLRVRVASLRNYNKKILRAKIEATALENIEASGAATIRTSGQFYSYSSDISLSGASTLKDFTFDGNRLEAHISGASDVNLRNVQMNSCIVKASGASDFYGSGYAAKTSFSGSGSSNFQTYNFESENLDVDLSGASSAEVTVNHTIKGELSGASKLKYRNAEDVSGVSVAGSSKIIRD